MQNIHNIYEIVLAKRKYSCYNYNMSENNTYYPKWQNNKLNKGSVFEISL